MRAVTVIADDFTGAADCGAAFAAAGLATFVALSEAPPPPAAQVVAVDTDSRRLPRAGATQRTGAAARRALASGSRALYKKIDSTLRGNVGVEVAAAFHATAEAFPDGRPLVVASPAFPAAARIVRDGRVLVHGVPLADSEVWVQSGSSGPSELAEMLRRSGLTVSMVHPGAGGDSGGFARRLAVVASGVEAIVCDAEDEADLRAIADAGARLPRPIVWTGSAGLARHLPAALGLTAQGGDPSRSSPWRQDAASAVGPVLILVGSPSEVSREQARRVGAEAGVESLVVSSDLLRAGAGGAAWAEIAQRVARALAAGRDVVLAIDSRPGAPDPTLAAALGALVSGFRDLGGLLATGGDTARAVLAARGVCGLHLVGEVEPGVPMGLTDEPRPLRVITKAGGFGTASTLQRCRAALKDI
jgi:uncharacterized protein YgbK (DUF1537 family)